MADLTNGLTAEDQDWTKQTWDLYTYNDGVVELVTDLHGLLDVLGVEGASDEAKRAAVSEFVLLPAWNAAPKALFAEVRAWLGAK